MAKQPKKRSWIIVAKCIVRKEIVVANCTREEAKENPWANEVLEEREIESLIDWRIESIEKNE